MINKRIVTTFVMIVLSLGTWAQSAHKSPVKAHQGPKDLMNPDVIKMVKAGLAESTVITTIQTRKSKFDVSPDGLIALHNAGVTQAEMDAIMAIAGGAGQTPSATPAAYASAPPEQTAPVQGTPPAPSASPRSRLPVVSVVQNGGTQDIPLEKTQLAQTKTKPTSMKSLASDSVLAQALTSEVNTATIAAASHVGSLLGGTTMQQAGTVFSGLMSHRKPSVTYVWGVPNPTSANILQTSSPKFTVNFSNSPGVNPDEFEPAIVKLTPAQSSCRILGATQGKEDAGSNSAADWQLYSSFLEERVAVNSQKLGKGHYELSPSKSLMPGEYAVVLRPLSRSKKFSGGDVARAQGDGLMFDAAWSFQISDDAQ